MKDKRYCLGDIHGNYKALIQVLKRAKFDYNKDELIFLGDDVDGYTQSYEVVEELLKIKNLTYIIGNHTQWVIEHIKNNFKEQIWLSQGGKETIQSYKDNGYFYPNFPQTHKDLFNNGKYWYEVDDMLFIHGGFEYPKHPKDCTHDILTWDRSFLDRCKCGLKVIEWKKIFLAHTTTENEEARPIIIDKHLGKAAKIIQVDCGAGWKGRLCLYNIDTDEYFLSDYAQDLNT